MLEIPSLQTSVPVPETDADAIRSRYLAEADTVGSVPPATSISGVFGSVVQALSGNRMSVLLDKLGERAAFERSGTRLYDAMLVKLASGNARQLPDGLNLAALERIRGEEARHFEMLSEAIEQLGGDPTTQTPCADVSGVMGGGLLQVITDPRSTVAQSLQALLAAELVDNASWELLIELCEGFGLDELRQRFGEELHPARRHRCPRRWR